jgi:hypothetical protein
MARSTELYGINWHASSAARWAYHDSRTKACSAPTSTQAPDGYIKHGIMMPLAVPDRDGPGNSVIKNNGEEVEDRDIGRAARCIPRNY